MGKKKKFFDKKKASTFQLMARDSSDPLYDESVPGSDRVFVRVDNNDANSIFADAPEDNEYGNEEFGGVSNRMQGMMGGTAPLPEELRREILELGFPDDGYNYLSHLREIKNSGGGSSYFENPKAKLDQLPNDIKAYDASRLHISEVKGESSEKSIWSVASKSVGVKIQKVVDPEVAKLLDDSDVSQFGSDVEDLEEDFVLQANLCEERDDKETDEKFDSVEEYEVSNNVMAAVDLVSAAKGYNHLSEAGADLAAEKPRIRRLLDDQFDLLESQEYGSDSGDDYGGYIAEEDESLANKFKNVLDDNAMDDPELDNMYKVPADLLHNEGELAESAAVVIRRCVEYAEKYADENEEEEVVVVEESSDESELWDCDTIVSTYSNLDNHPAKIGAPEVARKKKLAETLSGAVKTNNRVITLGGKEKLPVDYLPRNRKDVKEKVKEPTEMMNDADSLRTEQLKRKQHGQESKEERKERKAAVKEERREARRMKKEMRGLFKCETQRAQRVAAVSGPSSIHLM